jgi:hypothetical protein
MANKKVSFKLTQIPVLLLFGLVMSNCTTLQPSEIDLSGTWKFKMDEQDLGIDEKWFANDLPETVELPGSMPTNDKGIPTGYDTKWMGNIRNYADGKPWFEQGIYKPYLSDDEFRFPFWLIPEKYYAGAAWYQREVEIPDDWENKSIELFLERCHWETQVWVNENFAGNHTGMGVPHRYDIGEFLHPGKNKITICVDNRAEEIQVGINAHSVTDNTQSNWNGIVGDLKLVQKDMVSISNVQIFPSVKDKNARVEIQIQNNSGNPQSGKLKLTAKSTSTVSPQKIKTIVADFSANDSTNKVVIEYPLGKDVRLWDEFNPNLYELAVELTSGKNKDLLIETFGMRDFRVEGTRFTINGRPVFLRGTLECAIFPKTGFPPTDVESWERIIKIAREHGLNHLRFHSWCPPEAAFEAADKLGFYYQVEVSAWATIGDGKPIDQWIYDESERMVAEYGNHPSFCLMSHGNEPNGSKHTHYLREFVQYWKSKDNRRVYTSGAGWPAIDENDYHNLPEPRIQGWAEELKSIINAEPPRSDYDWGERLAQYNIPVVSHEIGQWCVYPNFREMEKYDGVLKPTNFEIFKRSLEANGMLQLADSFLLASGKLQALCYKADIEAALRTPGFAGFQLLDLHDFPGQGTALVGVLDPFWEEKGYISPEEFNRFCNETVPLARFKKRIFTDNENIEIAVEVAHFGETELQSVVGAWKIVDTENNEVLKGEFPATDLNWGNGIQLGVISKTIPVESAKKFILELDVAGFTNAWDFWVYPAELPKTGGDILVVSNLNKQALETLENGGKVLLTTKKGSIKAGKGGEVGIGFSSIFWNTAWTNGQKPHTLGILCNPQHPALAEFPSEYHSNWQWWDAMSHSNAINIEGFSPTVNPIVRVIDDWVTNRPLALIFEAKMGKGSLLFSGIDLQTDLETRAEARQLLYSLKNYMAGENFKPKNEISADEILSLFE